MTDLQIAALKKRMDEIDSLFGVPDAGIPFRMPAMIRRIEGGIHELAHAALLRLRLKSRPYKSTGPFANMDCGLSARVSQAIGNLGYAARDQNELLTLVTEFEVLRRLKVPVAHRAIIDDAAKKMNLSYNRCPIALAAEVRSLEKTGHKRVTKAISTVLAWLEIP